jgi:hypothetical protein
MLSIGESLCENFNPLKDASTQIFQGEVEALNREGGFLSTT